jgi:hypothetical protein
MVRDKLISKLFKMLTSEKDEIEEQLGRDKFKADISVADGERKLLKIDKNDDFVADGKSRRFGVFWTDFGEKCQKVGLYGFMEKQPPQKALCLGPDPPWDFQ